LCPLGLTMQSYLRALDWKVLVFALVVCYVLPEVFFGTVITTVIGDGASGARSSMALLLIWVSLLAAPLASGYFTARFATALPKLHVGIVALLGVAIFQFRHQSPWEVQLIASLLVIAVCALGAFLYIRKERAGEA